MKKKADDHDHQHHQRGLSALGRPVPGGRRSNPAGQPPLQVVPPFRYSRTKPCGEVFKPVLTRTSDPFPSKKRGPDLTDARIAPKEGIMAWWVVREVTVLSMDESLTDGKLGVADYLMKPIRWKWTLRSLAVTKQKESLYTLKEEQLWQGQSLKSKVK